MSEVKAFVAAIVEGRAVLAVDGVTSVPIYVPTLLNGWGHIVWEGDAHPASEYGWSEAIGAIMVLEETAKQHWPAFYSATAWH